MARTVFGYDGGFAQNKAVADDWHCKFGSITKKRSVASTRMEDSEGYLVKLSEQEWNVGSKGTYDFSADRMKTESDIPKLLAVFGLYNQETGKRHIDWLVTGLPVMEYEPYRAGFQAALKRTFSFEFEGKQVIMEVRNVRVIPQEAGAYYDYILTDDGELREEPLASENVLVFGIGGRTSDGCIMEASKYSQDSFTIFHGVWKAHAELRKLILKKYHLPLQPYEVDAIMRSGSLALGGTSEDVTGLVKIAIEITFPNIRDELTLYVDDFRRFSAMLLPGGGAYVYGDYLADYTKIPCIRVEQDGARGSAEYANARGNRKYGLLMEGLN